MLDPGEPVYSNPIIPIYEPVWERYSDVELPETAEGWSSLVTMMREDRELHALSRLSGLRVIAGKNPALGITGGEIWVARYGDSPEQSYFVSLEGFDFTELDKVNTPKELARQVCEYVRFAPHNKLK